MATLPLILILLGQSGYVGSPLPVIDAALIAANVQASDVVYDLGSGDGRVVCLASKKYRCKSVGVELDANLVNISRFTALRNGVNSLVTIRHEDALKTDLSDATVVYLYHQTEFLGLLRPQLEELCKGTRVIFLDHKPTWLELSPITEIDVEGHHHKIYLWVVDMDGSQDSTLIAAGKHYPGVRFYRGKRNPLLVQLAQDCADLLAKRGAVGYWSDGHPNWDTRYREIHRALGRTGVEVTAFSWPNTSKEFTPEIAYGLYYDWDRSSQPWETSSHWKIVSTAHELYGEGVAQDHAGIWYGCIIVAD